jgi:hypothetical protein
MILVFEKKNFIPTGTEFNLLLNSEHISYGEILNTLKQKGIFVRDSEKSNTVPILSATLLKPSEFDKLINSSVSREQKIKIKSPQKLSLKNTDSNWINPIRNKLSDFDPCDKLDNVELLQSLNVLIEKGNKVKIPYSIRRRDYSKDYLKRDLSFRGEISLEQKNGEVELKCSSQHTSPETEKINKRIIKKISTILIASGVIEEKLEQKITFGAFTPKERVRFFKRLTGGYLPVLDKGDVNNMEIRRDSNSPPLPDDPEISWMRQSVTHLKVDGEKLNGIFLIANEKYYAYYHVQKLDVTFPFSVGTNDGDCRISFYFSGTSTSSISEESELIAEVSKVNYEKKNKVNNEAKRMTESAISNSLEKMFQTEFDKIMSERQKQ